MINYQVFLTLNAVRDLKQVVEYLTEELKNPAAATRLVNTIKAEIIKLTEFPYRYAPVKDERLAGQGFRLMVVDKHLIFYLINEREKTVSVIRILYGKRNWINLL